MKYWKALMAAALLFGLSSCGGGDDSDKNDPPPPTPGDPGSVVFSAKAPVFVSVAAPEGAAAKSTEKLAVDFSLKDAQGNPVEVGTTEISFSVTKLIPGRVVDGPTGPVAGPSIWKAFIYSKSKATFEKSTAGTLENLGNGNYRYLFAIDFKNVLDPYPTDSADNGGIIAWDDGKLHRLAVTFGSAEEGSTMPLINYTLDWVPSGGTAALTRDILEMESCSDCHMDQPIHHSTRNDPKVCVACHNDSNPTQTGRMSLAVLAHKYHSTGKDNVDASLAKGGHYPQDPRNCDTCHKPATPSTPNANDWTVPTEQTCKACHADYASPVKEHHTGEDCRACHADGNADHASAGVTNVHLNRLKGMQAGAATLKIDIKHALYDVATKQVTIGLSISESGSPIEMQRLSDIAYMSPGLLVNWDEGEGQVLPNSHSSITLKNCTGGTGDFTCVTDPILEAVPASDAVLTITVADMGLCVEKKATELDGLPAGLKACPADGLKTISKDHFEYIAAPNIPVAHFDLNGNPVDGYQFGVGVEKALCENCHKNFEIHFGGTAYDHAARDFNQCGNCHNANRASFYTGMAGDLKYHVHSYHAMGSHRGAAHAATEDEAKALIPFPGKVNNCESCHTQEQFNLPNQKNVRPSVVSKITNFGKDNAVGGIGDNADTRANKFYSPALVACGSCHLKSELGNVNLSTPVAGDEWASHMQENGAVFGADTAEAAIGVEQCDSCHAIGQEQGVDKVHKVFDFR
ncbi:MULTISPECIES: OmcA/MtrC family decaheme c-type cytochrome [Aeromonas]|uniref:OmcA/MtrC family decaheme c-type cytochrome n=1 Tax=Aeromonas TaxID=642 RepID=UPI001F4AA0A0|nr:MULTISPECIES: OmcA/MtrC family decaheme c-type cytochrome [Aeromonas]MCH7369607.1 OmcA/MtrC family decaheme c-type cytochrome [Aeromonas sp. MR16]